MLWELLRETFDVDSRILRTFALLLTKPGELALEFSRNRRARYISPIRLYLFISLGFFFLLSSTSTFELDFDASNDELTVETIEEDVAADLNKILNADRIKKVQSMLDGEKSLVQQQAALAIAKGVTERTEPLTESQRFLAGQMVDALYRPIQAANTMFENLPIAMFFLLPVFALILQLLYVGSHKYYVEHLVFATHLHSFAFLIYAAMLVLPEFESDSTLATISGWASALLWLVLPVYHFKSLRRYYGQGFARTCVKYFVQMAIYFVLLTPVSIIAVLLLTLATV